MRCVHLAARIARYVWAAPCTAVGLCLVAPAFLFGATARVAHEQAHVRQYERWGVFFFVAYPAASLWQLLRCRRPYIDNWFEVQAREGRSNEPREA